MTQEREKGKFPEKGHAFVSKAVAVTASITEPDEKSGPKRRLEEEFDLKEAVEAINSRNLLSATGSDGLHFSYLRSIAKTGFGREQFRADIEAFWARIVDDLHVYSRRSLTALLAIQLHMPWVKTGENCRAVRVEMARRRCVAAGTMRQRRPVGN